MKFTKIADGYRQCNTCGAIMYDTAGYYCSWRCEAIGECGE